MAAVQKRREHVMLCQGRGVRSACMGHRSQRLSGDGAHADRCDAPAMLADDDADERRKEQRRMPLSRWSPSRCLLRDARDLAPLSPAHAFTDGRYVFG